jgi:23S rRNA pseudouridine955/2504/2580 synthase
MTLRIIHDADGVVVVDKPPFFESTGRTLDDPRSVQNVLARMLRRKVWAVHQLDRETSGVLVFVRRRALVAPWQARLAAGRKLYLALCHGDFVGERRIEERIAYDEGARRWVVRNDGRTACTIVRRVNGNGSFTWVEAELATGRTHQARVHLAHIGHPLVGERRYRDPPCELHPRHALHAARIEVDGMTFTAPLPDDLRDLAKRLRLPDCS